MHKEMSIVCLQLRQKHLGRKDDDVFVIKTSFHKHIRQSYILLIRLNQKTSSFYTKMSRQPKPLSMMESCLVFQRRNRRIFGERTLAVHQQPPKVSLGHLRRIMKILRP